MMRTTDELMFEIRDLTGQDYRNTYAGKTADIEPTVVAKVATLTDRDAELVGAAAGS
jgi:hypothetical protein